MNISHPFAKKTEKSAETPPTLLIIMGVSGCGKSSIAQCLATELNFTYIDADDFHSDAAKAQMSQGHPLSDAMREPWVTSIVQHLNVLSAQGKNCTLAFSGLKTEHRKKIFASQFLATGFLLKASKELITQRITARSNHFMPPALLDSQFSSLEAPLHDENIFQVDCSESIKTICQYIYSCLS